MDLANHLDMVTAYYLIIKFGGKEQDYILNKWNFKHAAGIGQRIDGGECSERSVYPPKDVPYSKAKTRVTDISISSCVSSFVCPKGGEKEIH